MENNNQKENSKEFQAEEIDQRYEMDTANPLPANQTGNPGDPPCIVILTPPDDLKSAGW